MAAAYVTPYAAELIANAVRVRSARPLAIGGIFLRLVDLWTMFLRLVQAALVAPGKGILAADESGGTIGKRFAGIRECCCVVAPPSAWPCTPALLLFTEVENNEENRRLYRQLLFTTEGLGQWISGAILFHETLFHKTDAGVPFTTVLKNHGILAGIKVDAGTADIAGTDGETVTTGLDGLAKRCAEYYAAGARFAKWRGVIKISDKGAPSELAIQQNVNALAQVRREGGGGGLGPSQLSANGPSMGRPVFLHPLSLAAALAPCAAAVRCHLPDERPRARCGA
jgi:hypothetical protein